MFIPKDNDIQTKLFLESGNGGVCGIACLAVIEESFIQDVLNNWDSLNMEFRGFTQYIEILKYLRSRGYSIKQLNSYTKILFSDRYYIARIQWIGPGIEKEKPFYGWPHWSQACRNTHLIVLYKNQFFCNETGWGSDLDKYLSESGGVITSYLETSKLPE